MDRLGQGDNRGDFPAIGLFVDVAGFSTITDALMAHGQHGAEVLATIMRSIFTPLAEEVHGLGGFVATLAGDAFTALFPIEEGEATHLRALAAAWRIQERMRGLAHQPTPYGDFSISAKLGLATGEVRWGVVQDKDGRRAVYYFQGAAVDACVHAEQLAQAGQVVLDPEMYRAVADRITAESVEGHYRLTGVLGQLPDPEPVQPPPPRVAINARFFSESLATKSPGAEFRQIVYLFISLPTVRTEDQLEIFLQSLFALQDRYGGHLNRLSFGDKGSTLLLFWGAPVAHEDDLQRALNFVLDLQTQTIIPINAGVAHQIAHAGFIGSPFLEEYTGYGRGANLAARFMTAAPRGEIWIDESVARRAERQFEIEYEGEMRFKGFTEPQTVYLLIDRMEEVGRIYEGEIVGREAELQQLAHFIRPLWERKYAGGLVIWGDAGIGKSRLVYEFQTSETLVDRTLLWASCPADKIQPESFSPFRYWLRQYFRQSVEQSTARNKRNFNRRLDALIEATEATLAEELDRTRSFLGALVHLHWPDSLYEQLDPETRYENTLIGLITLLRAEGAQQPVIVHLEDAHWLDDDSRVLLSRLDRAVYAAGVGAGEATAEDPIAILAAARRDLEGPLLGEGLKTREIDLSELATQDVTRLAESHLQEPAGPDLIDLLKARAEGNPLFVEQILDYLQERDLLTREDKGWELKADFNRSPLPADVRTLLVARLDRLDVEVRELVQHAAVLGREFEVRLLSHMLGEERQVMAAVGRAERAGIWRALSQHRYMFQHALLRDAAYGLLTHTRRRLLHGRVVEAISTVYSGDLEPFYGELAYHAERSGDRLQAGIWYLQAAERDRDRGTMQAARAYFDRSLRVLPEEEREHRWRALVGRAEVLGILGEVEALQTDLDAMLRLAEALGDGERVSEAHYKRGHYAYSGGDDRAAMVAYDAALAAASGSGNRRVEALTLGLKLVSEARLGETDAAIATGKEALAKAESLGDESVMSKNLHNLAILYQTTGDVGRAVEFLARQVRISRSRNDLVGEAHGLLNLAYHQLLMGRHESARRAISESLNLAASLGARRLQAYNLLHLCLAEWRLGNTTAAREALEAAQPILIEIADVFGEAASYSYLGLVLEAESSYHDAAAWYEKARAMFSATGAEAYYADALAGLSRCMLATGRPEQAVECAREVWEVLSERRDAGGSEFPTLAYLSCARAFAAVGDAARARKAAIAGHRDLMGRAEKIDDPEWRRVFLEEVPEHQALIRRVGEIRS